MNNPIPFNQMPFADLMLHPEKPGAVLKSVKNKNGASAVPRTTPPTGVARNKQPQQNRMKTEWLPWTTITVLAVMALAGCERHSEYNPPATTNTAVDQPMPGASVSNNVVIPPAPNPGEPNSPATTNSPGTTNPPAANP